MSDPSWQERAQAEYDAMPDWDVESLRALLEGITPGEWRIVPDDEESSDFYMGDEFAGCFKPADAEFVAAAPSVLAWCLTEIERLQAEADTFHEVAQETAQRLAHEVGDLRAQLVRARPKNEQHQKANLVRAVMDGYGTLDEFITDAINQQDFDRVPWLVAENATAALVRARTALADQLFDAIAHGDEKHRAWLKETLERELGVGQ